MSYGFEIAWPASGTSVAVSQAPLGIGRAPGNGIVLNDETISWHHAQVWEEAGSLWVRDLGSRNGTYINEKRLSGSARLTSGDQLRIGRTETLVARGAQRVERVHLRYLIDPSVGTRVMVRSNRMRLGSGTDCVFRIPSWPAYAGTLISHSDGELWMGTPTSEFPVVIGESFELAGRVLLVVDEPSDHAPTVDFNSQTYEVALTISSSTNGEPEVLVVEGERRVVISGNRAALLTVLARKRQQDLKQEVVAELNGWCAIDSCITGVWGRSGKGRSQLNVLVHRLRQQLSKGGLDPYFLEKRRSGIRVVAQKIDD